jgi:hypothetical protein
MVMVKHGIVSLGLPDLDGMVRTQGIAFPVYSDVLDAE